MVSMLNINSAKLRNSNIRRPRHFLPTLKESVTDLNSIYTALLYEKFIRLLMINGQKSKAYKIFNKTLSILNTKINSGQ